MKCKFCGKQFQKESTYIDHSCVKKKRWALKSEKPNIIAFDAFRKFMSNLNNKEYTYEEFINSRLYIPFIKFANFLMELHAINPQDYTDFLIRKDIKVANWIKDSTYESYLKELLAKESPDRAIERSIVLAANWAIDKEKNLEDFFSDVSTNQAIAWIVSGKLSPWFIFASSKSERLLNRFSDEQHHIINSYIDRGRWKLKIKKHRDDFERIQKVLIDYGI